MSSSEVPAIFVFPKLAVNQLRQLNLEQAVHVGLHVGDGHPLHDDIRDPALQRLPFVASDSGGVNPDGAPVGRPAHTASCHQRVQC